MAIIQSKRLRNKIAGFTTVSLQHARRWLRTAWGSVGEAAPAGEMRRQRRRRPQLQQRSQSAETWSDWVGKLPGASRQLHSCSNGGHTACWDGGMAHSWERQLQTLPPLQPCSLWKRRSLHSMAAGSSKLLAPQSGWLSRTHGNSRGICD